MELYFFQAVLFTVYTVRITIYQMEKLVKKYFSESKDPILEKEKIILGAWLIGKHREDIETKKIPEIYDYIDNKFNEIFEEIHRFMSGAKIDKDVCEYPPAK